MQLPIYVINLQRSPQRLAHAAAELARVKLSFERIDAVDGRALTAAEIDAVYDAKRNQQRFYADLSLGEIACYMSHRKAWSQLLASEHHAAIILEDDIKVTDGLSALSEVPFISTANWDLIKIAQPFKPKTATPLTAAGQFTLVDYRNDKPPMGACGYIISRRGATKLLSRERFFRPVDVDMQWQWETGCYVQGLMPYCVDNTHQHGSDILSVEDRHLKDKSAWRRFKEVWRFYWQNRRFNPPKD